MAYQITCDVFPTQAYVAGRFADGLVACDTGWVISEVQESSFAGLIDLLTFNPVTFGALLGTCIVIFIMGYSAGHVARLMGRV